MHKILNFSKKKRAGKCLTPHCRKAARVQRNYCNTCRSRAYDNPLRRLFWNLKASAKRRGKQFSLAFEEFASAALASGYFGRSGRHAECLHVDRVDPLRGYEDGNIRFISCSENSRKAYLDKKVLSAFTAQELTPF